MKREQIAQVLDQTRHGGTLGICDVAVIGGGIAGLATAARLQAQGQATMILEAHSLAGGCAGYFRRAGFSFDVGATTLVDFEPGGVGGEFLDAIGIDDLDVDPLPGYVAWLPDREVLLHRDLPRWHDERLAMLGDTDQHRSFWRFLDRLARVFWDASRRGVKLPLQGPVDVARAARILGPRNWLLGRCLFMTLGDALRAHGLRDDTALVALLSMLVEDTVHASIDHAPLINAALGITIRGAGLSRAPGGMRGFIGRVLARYGELGGRFVRNCRVDEVSGVKGAFMVRTSKGTVFAQEVVSAIPAATTARIAPDEVGDRLKPYLRRDADAVGGAIVVFLGVPEAEVDDHEWTHHQLLHDYDAPLGLGNNMFVSVSSPGDTASAPPGYRAVMISTHCEPEPWMNAEGPDYEAAKAQIGERLVRLARRVYPRLATAPLVYEVATPRTYARFASRPGGAVGGVRQTLRNTNQHAIPHDIGVDGFHLVGDTTWPGLGTVACTLGSRIVTEQIVGRAPTQARSTQRATPDNDRNSSARSGDSVLFDAAIESLLMTDGPAKQPVLIGVGR